MARIGKIQQGIPAWQKFDPEKTKLTKNQNAALKRKELQALCEEVAKQEKIKPAFYQVNKYGLDSPIDRYAPCKPEFKSVSRFVTKA